MGWLDGYDKAEILGFQLTAGNQSDLSVLPSLTEKLFGRLFGDKGYICQEMFENLFTQGIELITKLRANMKNKFMKVIDKILLRKRGMIYSVIGKLKAGCQIEHSRHRNPCNFIVNLLSGLVSYCLSPDKPSVSIQKSALRLLNMQSV